MCSPSVTGEADTWLAAYAVSEAGPLMFQTGLAPELQLTWFDREGNAITRITRGDTVSIQMVLEGLQIQARYWTNTQTKLLALLVKAVWDLQTWNRCWNVLYGAKAKAQAIQLPYSYKTAISLKNIEERLTSRPDRAELERLLVAAAVTALVQLQLKPVEWRPKTLAELNGCWHTPHRWRDLGISLYYIASKHK